MKNFEFEYKGNKFWYSRSLACILFIIRYDELSNTSNYDVLAVKRGIGCEYAPGTWNVPGGFIDFNENAKQCVIRETMEETGVNLEEYQNDILFLQLDTEPTKSSRQSIVALHAILIPKSKTYDWKFSTQFSEENEVDEIKWINMKDINDYQWMGRQRKYFNIFKEYFKL